MARISGLRGSVARFWTVHHCDRLTFGAPTFVWHGSKAPTSRLRICGVRKAWFAPSSPPRGA
jgi:hypothetical protein